MIPQPVYYPFRNTILATVNKVYLDRYLEDYQKQRKNEMHSEKRESAQGI